MSEPLLPDNRKLIWRDVTEIMVGSCLLAFPVSVTEEVWTISETLPFSRALYLLIWSVIFIAFFTYHRYFNGCLKGHVGRFVIRVCAVYFITMICSTTIVLAVKQLMTAETAIIAIKRVIIVSFPASFAATVVDGMSKE
jgi:uncharacterized membrane protein